MIEVDFPAFGDGRGYSAAQILREEGYDGELRASGDVLVDQLAYMRRCGFDSFAPEKSIDPKVMERALDRYEHVYQGTTDQQSSDLEITSWVKQRDKLILSMHGQLLRSWMQIS